MLKKLTLFALLIFVFLVSIQAKETKRDLVGLFPIEQNDKWGYIDRTGKIVIKPQFDYANYFYEGLAVVLNDKQELLDGSLVVGKYGYIDKKGKVVIKPQFEEVENFVDGLAAVYGETRYSDLGHEYSILTGYINEKGKFVWKRANKKRN